MTAKILTVRTVVICSAIFVASTHLSLKDIMAGLVKAYEVYSGCKIDDQDKAWAPHFCCAKCAVDLRACLRGT